MSEPYPHTDLYTVCDPDGHLCHTVVSTEPDGAIEEWLKTEQTMHLLYNAARACSGQEAKCCPSWEHFEAEGYSIVKVNIVPAK